MYKITYRFSGGCNPVNWLSQTRRNLTIEYLNLNFVTTPKLTPLHSFYSKKVFVSCVWLISVSWVCVHVQAFSIRYFAAYRFGCKVFNQIGTRRYFQLVEKGKCFVPENAKKVVEGLGTGSFVTVNDLTPRSCGCGKIPPGKFFL